jgi:pimeloyl-ACP methyl ester carboxylesterase
MQHATSGDGTLIALDEVGDGVPVVLGGGAFSTAEAGAPLAAELADAGLRGVTVDRRARGNSGDSAPYAPCREVDDLAAPVNAIGGEAAIDD